MNLLSSIVFLWVVLPSTFAHRFAMAAETCSRESLESDRKSAVKLIAPGGGYQRAIRKLKKALECAQSVDRAQFFWILSDLALLSHKSGDDNACLDYLNQAKFAWDWKQADEKAAKAIAFNDTLCIGKVEPGESFLSLCKRAGATSNKLKATIEALYDVVSPRQNGTQKLKNCEKADADLKTRTELALPAWCWNQFFDLRPLLYLPRLTKLELVTWSFQHCKKEVVVSDWSPLSKLNLKELSISRGTPNYWSPEGDGYLQRATDLPVTLEKLSLLNYLGHFSLEGIDRLEKLTSFEWQNDWENFRLEPPYHVVPHLSQLKILGWPTGNGMGKFTPTPLPSSLIDWIAAQPALKELEIGLSPVKGTGSDPKWGSEAFAISASDVEKLRKKRFDKLSLNGKSLLQQ